MNRRLFLAHALAAVPAVVIGAELVELIAPRKSIFLPPRGGWRSGYAADLYEAIEITAREFPDFWTIMSEDDDTLDSQYPAGKLLLVEGECGSRRLVCEA